MGSFDNSRGIQTGVHRETSSIENKENFSFFKRYKNFTSRSKHFIRKRCNRTSTKSRESGFYSTFFLVPKKNGKMRPIINLKPLNRYLKKTHFKMDTLSKVLNLVKTGDWAISLDLKDAYLHVPIFHTHRKYLRFCIQNQCYQFKVLCFGPTSAPRVFTKIVSVVAAYLRTLGIRLAVYLDDWLIVNQNKRQLLSDRENCLNLLKSLGFLVNKEKSTLIPTQTLIYLGGLFHLDKGLIYPTQERIVELNLLTQEKASAFMFLHLLGIMASCVQMIPNARLFMRPVQLHLLSFWRPVRTTSLYKFQLLHI